MLSVECLQVFFDLNILKNSRFSVLFYFGIVYYDQLIAFDVQSLAIRGQQPFLVPLTIYSVHVKHRTVDIASHTASLKVLQQTWVHSLKLKGSSVQSQQLNGFHQQFFLLSPLQPKQVVFFSQVADNLNLKGLFCAQKQRSVHQANHVAFIQSLTFDSFYQVLTPLIDLRIVYNLSDVDSLFQLPFLFKRIELFLLGWLFLLLLSSSRCCCRWLFQLFRSSHILFYAFSAVLGIFRLLVRQLKANVCNLQLGDYNLLLLFLSHFLLGLATLVTHVNLFRLFYHTLLLLVKLFGSPFAMYPLGSYHIPLLDQLFKDGALLCSDHVIGSVADAGSGHSWTKSLAVYYLLIVLLVISQPSHQRGFQHFGVGLELFTKWSPFMQIEVVLALSFSTGI